MEKNLSYFKKAIYIREFESLLLDLFNKGLLNGTVHTCVGQELIPVTLSEKLITGDRIFSNHRGHGHYLAFNGDTLALLSELLGKEEGVSKGIGGSQHLFNSNFISNGIQGGLSPISAGYSYVNKKRGNKSITINFIGDGTLGQGILYESLNLVSLLGLPTLFILENNQYAQSTSIHDNFSGNLENRITGFGLEYFQTNIWDLEHLDFTLKAAVEYVRNGKPAFVEVKCYRLNSHSKGDDNRREKEIASYIEKDLINKFKKTHEKIYSEILLETKEDLNKLLDQSLGMTDLEENQIFNFIEDIESTTSIIDYSQLSKKRVNTSIYNGLKSLISKTDSVFIGEDIQYKSPNTEKPYGGAFKVSGDLSELFPERVINSPISEQAIIGFGIGAALNGYRSIVEIMFGDFMTLGVDQIYQQASKIPSMFGQAINLPLVIRTPMGARRGYGPTHSQNFEKLFMFLPNINLIAINSLVDPEIIFNQINSIQNTSIVIEDKVGYTKFFPSNVSSRFDIEHTSDKLPTVILSPNFIKSNLIIFTYGGMLDELIEILDDLIENDIFPRIICPTSLTPLNISPLRKGLEHVKDIIFIEEGTKHGGLSSEIISYLSELKIHFNLVGRISNESIIPCSKNAELKCVPNSNLILQRIVKLTSNA